MRIRLIRVFFGVLLAARQDLKAQAIFRLYRTLRPLKRPIFVIGLNRSGTTVFTRYLGQTPQIVGWSEANEVWDPVGFPYESATTQRPFWPVDPQGYTDSVMESAGRAYFRAVPGIFSMYTDVHCRSHKTARFLNKSPMNTLRIGLMSDLFPDACFVSLVRDPRAVVRSWAEKVIPKLRRHPCSDVYVSEQHRRVFNVDGVEYPWTDMIRALSKSYSYVVTRQLNGLGALPERQIYYTRYEDFVRGLHRVLREIDLKFGISPEGRHWDSIPETLDDRNRKYREQFGMKELHIIESECGDLMQKLGYEKVADA